MDPRIFVLRGKRVMLDIHLAELYAVKAIRLREQVRRNIERFPEDFMFQLSDAEAAQMVALSAIPSSRHLGGTLPFAFTQEGVSMLSGVLRTPNAVKVNIAIMRAFVKMRGVLALSQDLVKELARLDRRVHGHDNQIEALFKVISRLMQTARSAGRIGFRP